MNKTILSLILLWVFNISCSDLGEVYMTDVNNSWNKNDSKNLEFEIDDAQIVKNIIFVVRNNNEYPYHNLFLISTLKNAQNKEISKDTLQYILAKPNGEWLGSGIGNIKETLFQYKLNYKFPANEKYRIEIKHGMRKDTLKGIEDIGVQISNSTQVSK